MIDNLFGLLGLSQDEQDEINSFNDTHYSFDSDVLIDDLIFNLAIDEETIACAYQQERLSRKVFLSETLKYAAAMQAQGIGRHDIVAIGMLPCSERLIAVLAVLKCGAAYLPIDISQPVERLKFLLKDSRTQMLLVNERISGLDPDPSLVVQTISELITVKDYVFHRDETRTATDAAYIIYTSGSTGMPKATINSHRALVNRLQWKARYLSVATNDLICHKTAFGFDVSVWEQLLPLLTGACAVIAPEGYRGDPEKLSELILQENITIIHFIPTMLAAFMEYEGVERCKSLRVIVCSGEELPKKTALTCQGILNVPVYNLYGPTEAAIDVTAWAFNPDDHRGFVPIGKPIQNVQMHILDEALSAVPVNSVGDLYIGGIAVGDGYLYRPGLTAERFIPDPFSDIPGSRMYKTGDIGRWNDDGAIEFLGRSDFQVKIRGFRIETGEIEQTLNRFPGVATSIVVAHTGDNGVSQLIAYLLPGANRVLETTKISAFLKEHLPAYMQPAFMMILDKMPFTTNGKLDRKALPAPFFSPAEDKIQTPLQTTSERLLAGIWSDLLKCEVNHAEANFFSLGGDSIQAIRMVIAARKKGLLFQVKDIFDYPALSQLADLAVEAGFEEKIESPLAALLKNADPVIRASSAPVIVYQISVGNEDLFAQKLKNLANLIADTPDGNTAFEFSDSSANLIDTLRRLRIIVANDTAIPFAASMYTDLKYGTLCLLVFNPAMADQYSLKYLPNLLEAATDRPWFMEQESVCNWDKTPKHFAYPMPVILSEEMVGAVGVNLLTKCYDKHQNAIGRERYSEALIVFAAALILEKSGMEAIQVILPESRSYLNSLGFDLSKLFGRMAAPFYCTLTSSSLSNLLETVKYVANARKGQFTGPDSETGIRFRVVLQELSPDNDLVTHISDLELSTVADLSAAENEILMVIGENRIEWRWDKKIGEWPGLIPEIMRGNLLLDTLVSNAVEIRLTRDFPLAKINEVQLDDIKNILKDSEDLYPLSPIQEGLLLRTVYWPESDAYLNQNVIELKGSLDIKSLNDAWNRTVNKYEILRSGYLWKKLEVPLQYVNSRPARQMEFCDWRDRAVTAEEKDACLEEFLASDRSQLFDMEEAGLFRLTLAQTGDDSYLLIWTHHHILLDGWCLALIWGDVFRFYADFTAGKPVAGTPPRSYHDYIAWLEQNPPGVKDREFWRNKLKGFGEATLFSALPSYVEGDFRTDRITISEEKLSDLRLAAAQTGITVNAYVQATWALLLGFRTGKKDVVHGISVSGRPTALTDSENIVGLFINTIPLRSDLSPARTLHELLLSTQENFASANNHSFLPLAAILVEWEGRTSNDKRLFDSLIAFENYPDEHLPATKVADIEIRDRFCNEKTEYPIGLIVLPGPPMEFHFNYDSRHFSVETMVQFAEDFFYLLDQLVYTPEKTLASLFLPSMEVLLKKTRSHALPVKISTTGLSEDVFINADKFPDKIAVIAGTEKLSWKELSKAVLRVASSMTTRASSQIIAICAERSVSFVIAALAAWKAGLVPVIFNPALSDEMICDVLQKMGNPDLAVTSKQYFRLNAWKSNGFIIDLVQGDEEKSFHNQIPDPIAAILMTSGTSGLPKQVMLTREGLANRVTATVNLYNRPDPCLLANAAPGFDIGLWEILFSVQQGGTLVLADDEDMKDPDHICELISSNQVNTLHLVPSFGEVLLTGTKSFMLSGIKLLITGGEVVHPAYISRIKEKMADAQVWQGYGPTEASVSVLDQNCNQVDLRGKRLPLGLPTANCQVYLLDEALRLCPEGVCGMIYIGGVAVAAGYFKDPRKTAAAFIPDPFGLPGERLYCTGDQGVRRPDGSIEFIGRKDRQVKIRGFRVELGFVEYQLASHPLVLKAAVMPNPELEDVELIAFIKLSCDPGMNDEEVSTLLQNWLTEHLPVWACPSKLFIIGDFPLTANGKIDMDKLFAEKPETRAVLPMDLTSLSEKEQVIWDVWTQILNTPPASRHENFFTAGGHSLSAMRFCMLLQQKLGEDTKVPVALLFKYGTPATLAEAISINDGSEGAAPCIYTIGEGEGIPLVLIHPVEGTSIAYGQLPALLPGQKIIVIDDPRFHKTDGFSSLREMAALYTEWIRLHTDDGPVILGGWSFGGLIALEIARLMSDHGRVPDGVLLIDSYNFSKRIAFLGEQTTGKSIDSVPDKIDEKLKAELNREIKRNRLLALSAPEMTYKGKVTLLKAEDRPEELDLDLGMNNGWTNAHLPSLQVKYVPGNHHELFSKSYIPALAAALKTFIQEI